MDCSLPGSSVRGNLQARILKWLAIPFSRGSSQPRDQTQVSCIAAKFLTIWATREAQRGSVIKESTWQYRRHGFNPWSGKISHVAKQLSPCATTVEPVLQSPGATNTQLMCGNYWSPSTLAHAPQKEKSPQWEASTPQLESSPCLPN